ncbi:PD40 domain-containing protein [Cellulophaga sp. HaHa_2_1]|nr:PD40 domain-containing protein [Cellulophaga sp. HaHa_2_1]
MNFVEDINPFIEIVMKNNLTYNVFFATMIAFSCYTTQAQDSDRMSKSEKIENTKRNENFKTLKNLGYSEKEIYEDLGNANFLSENYETALYWYTKLFKLSDGAGVKDSYVERYQFAMKKSGHGKATDFSKDKNWVASVKSDYYVEKSREQKFNDFYINPTASKKSIEDFVARETRAAITSENKVNSKQEELQIAITPDGTAAYFTKAVYVKPEYGVFSKKELVHKIFKAEKVSGQWKTVEEVALGPKNSSSMHPAISEDGKRLFFASDMPGTFGKFDIYVADLKSNGKFGTAKNLGKKVNTDENDLYPNIVGGTSLFFASNGHKGYGGLDVFMVEVANNRVGASVNLGSPINSSKDEFSLDIMNKNGTGYVLINRGKDNGAVERVAFSYSKSRNSFTPETKDDGILEAMNTESKINYATSIFEDK